MKAIPIQTIPFAAALAMITLTFSTTSSAQVKYIYSVDYPLAQKAAYLDWVKTVAPILQAPAELKRISSYDNFYAASPHRIVEFEFSSLEDAGAYYSRPDIHQALNGVSNHGVNRKTNLFKARADYEPAAERGQVKMVVHINYPVGGKAEYLDWVASIAATLQAPEEVISIVSFDNVLATNPHRIIEWEFASIADAHRYIGRPEIAKVFDEVVNHGLPAGDSVMFFELRGDYSK